MKNIIGMFLPFFLFLLFTIVLFIFLKNDNTTPNEPKQVKEIFSEVNVKKEVRVKKSRSISTSTSEVTRVRWNQHEGYERLVFDVSDMNSGSFTMDVDTRNNTKVHGSFIGYRSFPETLPNFITSTIVKDMEVYTQGNNGYNFTISLYRPIDYKVFALENPDRIVIDMY
jgi:hypothetical protein